MDELDSSSATYIPAYGSPSNNSGSVHPNVSDSVTTPSASEGSSGSCSSSSGCGGAAVAAGLLQSRLRAKSPPAFFLAAGVCLGRVTFSIQQHQQQHHRQQHIRGKIVSTGTAGAPASSLHRHKRASSAPQVEGLHRNGSVSGAQEARRDTTSHGPQEKDSDTGRRVPVRSLSLPAQKPQAVGRLARRRQSRVWPGEGDALSDQAGKGPESTGRSRSPNRLLRRTQTSVGPSAKQRSAGSTGWGSLLWGRARGRDERESDGVEEEDEGLSTGHWGKGSHVPGARRSWLWQKLQGSLFGRETGRNGVGRETSDDTGAGAAAERDGAVRGVGGEPRRRRGRQVSWDLPLAHAQSAVRELSSGLDVMYEGRGGGENTGFRGLGGSGTFSSDTYNDKYQLVEPVTTVVQELLFIDVTGTVVDVTVMSEVGLDLRAGFQDAAMGWTPDYLTIPRTMSECEGKMKGDSVSIGEPEGLRRKPLDMLTVSGVAARMAAELATFHSGVHPAALGESSEPSFTPLAASLLAHGGGSTPNTSSSAVHPVLLEPVRMWAAHPLADGAQQKMEVQSLDIAVAIGPCMALEGSAARDESSKPETDGSASFRYADRVSAVPGSNHGRASTVADASGLATGLARQQARAPLSPKEGLATTSSGDGSRRRMTWTQAIAHAGSGSQESMEWRLAVRGSGPQGLAGHARLHGEASSGGGGASGGERGDAMDGLQLDVQVNTTDHVALRSESLIVSDV